MKKSGLVVLSLFDGISVGQYSLKRAGIPVKTYYSSEVDPYAIKVCQSNFPNTKQIGDVRHVTGKNLPKIDLLIGGSPCQDLSIAGHGKGLKGKKSGLFYEYIRLLRELKPRYFLLENVASLPASERDKITKLLGVKPIVINSNRLSAQNRNRIYWTSIPNVKLPIDAGIELKDILQKNQPSSISGLNSIAQQKIKGNTWNYLFAQLKTKSQIFTGIKNLNI
jgi:DNA-cytosine methyltransferase